MDKEKLKFIMLDQREFFLSKKDLLKRDIDLNSYLKTKQVVIISGIRRSGKSSLLYLIKEKISLEDKNVLYFNFDDERLGDFTIDDFNKLFEIQIEIFSADSKNVVMFFDEIQNIRGWEKFVNRMHEKNIKIYVTGSNANLLSSEIATTLTGRNMVLNLHPFSFKEYLQFHDFNIDIKLLTTEKKANLLSQFNDYIKYGGFPLVVEEKNLELVKNYYKDILYRDIIARYNLSQIEEIKVLGSFLATNPGKLFSYSKLQEITKIKSLSTLKNYLDYFEGAYLFYYMKKFDFSIKKQILNPRKIYLSDLTFNSEIGFKFSEDIGRLLENIVFVELKRRGKEIYYHKDKKECDFVIKEGLDIVQAIQVTKSLNDPDTKKRELAGILNAISNYDLIEGLILTDDEEGEEIVDGKKIIIKPVWKWLLE